MILIEPPLVSQKQETLHKITKLAIFEVEMQKMCLRPGLCQGPGKLTAFADPVDAWINGEPFHGPRGGVEPPFVEKSGYGPAVHIFIHVITVRDVATDMYFFQPSCFSRKVTHELLHLCILHEHVPWQLHKTQRITRYGSKVKVTGPDYRIFYHSKIGQKCLFGTITHEPLRSASYFAHTCTLTTAQTLFNFNVLGQRSRSFICMWTKVHQIGLPNVENRSS